MVTLEGWAFLMYDLQDTGPSYMAVLFSLGIVIIGSFFLLNVILAVITDSLERAEEDMN
jgi:hypothetical protein